MVSWPWCCYISRWFTRVCGQTVTHPCSNHLIASDPIRSLIHDLLIQHPIRYATKRLLRPLSKRTQKCHRCKTYVGADSSARGHSVWRLEPCKDSSLQTKVRRANISVLLPHFLHSRYRCSPPCRYTPADSRPESTPRSVVRSPRLYSGSPSSYTCTLKSAKQQP